jgi:elongation factor P hydroxylase
MPISLSTLLSIVRPYLIRYNTLMIGGFDEPFYSAPGAGHPARIQFTHDYIRSALHELSHWCVAGKHRRRQDDYGYWYTPDGRTQGQQEAFFKAEVKPQAIEWAFSECCGIPFDVSVDNLDKQTEGLDLFSMQVKNQLKTYREQGFPIRTTDLLYLLDTTHKSPQHTVDPPTHLLTHPRL